jgi:hypothetical protein
VSLVTLKTTSLGSSADHHRLLTFLHSVQFRPVGVTMEFMSNVGGIDENKPSLFELLSETQLRELLEPSLRYALALATQRHPRYLIRILNRYDEFYALMMLLIERHYLRKWGGSFTENSYGLKRERVIATEVPRATRIAPALVAESTKLKRSDVWKSLLVIVRISVRVSRRWAMLTCVWCRWEYRTSNGDWTTRMKYTRAAQLQISWARAIDAMSWMKMYITPAPLPFGASTAGN